MLRVVRGDSVVSEPPKISLTDDEHGVLLHVGDYVYKFSFEKPSPYSGDVAKSLGFIAAFLGIECGSECEHLRKTNIWEKWCEGIGEYENLTSSVR